MSFRDNAFFRAVGALTLEIEWRFWRTEAWPWLRLPQCVFLLFPLAIAGGGVGFIAGHYGKRGGQPLDAVVLFFAFLLMAPVSPVYAFLRPIARLNPRNKQKLRLLAEWAINDFTFGASIFFFSILTNNPVAGPLASHLPILLAWAPFFILFLRAGSIRHRTGMRLQQIAKRRGIKNIAMGLGARSEKYLNSYFWDVCLMMLMLAATVFLRSQG